MLPTGLLDGAVSVKENTNNPVDMIKCFEDAKNLDRVNEKMPERRPSPNNIGESSNTNSVLNSPSMVGGRKSNPGSTTGNKAVGIAAGKSGSQTGSSTMSNPKINNTNSTSVNNNPTVPLAQNPSSSSQSTPNENSGKTPTQTVQSIKQPYSKKI